ncbi:MAG: hypothetical protein GC168_07245 [Candidatus Hydrogenedens sp.]|nr:hypothetical protein [Candidatus Hydrogenedens sp.]
MEALVRFRLMVVRWSLVLVALAAAGCYLWEKKVGLGLAMGGLGGVLAFWILARRVEKFAQVTPAQVHSEAVKGMVLRMAVYGVVLWRAWSLDPVGRLPLFAAVAGILIPRLVLYFLALTNIDLGKKHS